MLLRFQKSVRRRAEAIARRREALVPMLACVSGLVHMPRLEFARCLSYSLASRKRGSSARTGNRSLGHDDATYHIEAKTQRRNRLRARSAESVSALATSHHRERSAQPSRSTAE